MRRAAVLVLFILPILAIHDALAHSRLRSVQAVRSGDTTFVSVRFSAPVEASFCRFTLFAVPKVPGRPIPLAIKPGPKRTSELVLTSVWLEPGPYIFEFSILSSDGHRQSGSRDLSVE